MTKIGILNVTGYAGSELARILYSHPDVQLTSVTGRSAAGQELGDIFPHLADLNLMIEPELGSSVDLVLSALPHKASAEQVIPLLKDGIRVVDMSADFRLKSLSEYEEWYQVEHPAPQYLEEAVFGLPELHRAKIRGAQLVANPGCFSTSVILALAPLVKEGLVESDIVVDSKSGISGAGRGTSLFTHYSEVNENVRAYSLEGHRHLPEIAQELGGLTTTSMGITFVTHLVPMTRGILSSCYARLSGDNFQSARKAGDTIKELLKNFYADEPFIKICSSPPQTKQALGTNSCLLYASVDIRNQRLIVISCLDNLVKGAAGQAVQNMNLMLNIPEAIGLEALAVYP